MTSKQPQADAQTMASGTSNATTLVPDGNAPAANESHKKEGFFKRMSSHLKPGSSSDKPKRESISESGPYIFAFDPKQGKEVLQKNPHWPNEDSWKREEENKGQWAFGSMAGQQSKDFGGTVG